MTNIRPELLQRLEYLAEWKNVDVNQLLEEWLDTHEYDRTIADTTLDAIITIDYHQKIISFNLAAVDIFGYDRDEIIGHPIDILLPDALKAIHRHHIDMFGQSDDIKRHMNLRGKIQGQRKDGTHFPAEATIAKSGENDDLQFHVILRDISERVLITQTLEENKEQFQLIMDNIKDFVCLHDPDGNYTYVSPSCQQVTGYQADELLGRTLYDFSHPDDTDYIRQIHNTTLRGVGIDSSVYRFRHQAGHYIWIETKSHPIKNDAGDVTHIVTGTRDITPHVMTQQELEQERDLLEKLMETSPSGITVVDKSGKVDFSNKRAREILRLPMANEIDLTYDSEQWKHTHYDGSPWPDEKQPFVRVMKTKQPVEAVQHAIESPDGQRVLLSINGAPLFDEQGNISKVVFTIEDVTELKRAEESLRNSLEQEQDINNIKSRFLSMVSHEFRTPLSVIMTSTDILERILQEPLDERKRKRLDQIRQQVKHLDVQLDEISSFNKSHQTQPKLNLQPTFAVDLLHQLIADIQAKYPDSPPIRVITTHRRTDSIVVDPRLIQHIFSNLLSNAAKYSAGRGDITVKLRCEDSIMVFEVQDQGLGIPEKDKEQLFNYFYRGDNVGQVKGTGIGLAIVRQSVITHGGEIDFTSQRGVGSTFTVTIPIQKSTDSATV